MITRVVPGGQLSQRASEAGSIVPNDMVIAVVNCTATRGPSRQEVDGEAEQGEYHCRQRDRSGGGDAEQVRVVKAVVYRAYGAPPAVEDVPEPDCPDGGAVLEVRATGVCRSDWHAWRGHEPVALPHVLGHELASVVVATGRGVSRWHGGERVTVPFVCGCGTCEYCVAGAAQVCPQQTQPGFTGPGSFAERVAVHAA